MSCFVLSITDMSKESVIFFISFFMKKASVCSVGIDVSSKTLAVYALVEKGQGFYFEVPNTVEGIEQIKKHVQRSSPDCPIVMESTGKYHILSAVMLSEGGWQVSVINPLLLKKYHTSQIRKTKTDRLDAQLLAEVGMQEHELTRFQQSRADIQIRQKVALLGALEKEVQRVCALLKNYEAGVHTLGNELSPVEESLLLLMKNFTKQKDALEKEIITTAHGVDDANKQELLCSIPGISPYAATLLQTFYSLETHPEAKSWIAYMGLDCSVHQSGTWKGRGKVSKRGNAYLRKRFYHCAWGAVMNGQEFKEYYTQLRNKGRSYKEALFLIEKKLIRIAHAVLKSQRLYQKELCFS